jgi:hypothetical protein
MAESMSGSLYREIPISSSIVTRWKRSHYQNKCITVLETKYSSISGSIIVRVLVKFYPFSWV